ncbi:MAG: hypothetical protein GXP05_11580 [Alphaproteobacteria bacterium]|nr:hypothetical protein [Alphaproteobacteria bacterium]
MPLALLFLSACASPSPEFRGAIQNTVTMGGDQITVFYTRERAQAIRTNWRNKSQRKDAISRLVKAIEITTRCQPRLKTLQGDEVVVTVSLTCPQVTTS